MANQVTHVHVCPDCGRDGLCAAPECSKLRTRLCPRCMAKAWRHSRQNVRRARPTAPPLKAA
jgi:uncharacterized paraquat-inducible protein A